MRQCRPSPPTPTMATSPSSNSRCRARARPGRRDTETLHRIDPAVVKQEVQAAGFVLDGESDVLRNPDDAHNAKVFDPALRGKTDRFLFKFRKPAKGGGAAVK